MPANAGSQVPEDPPPTPAEMLRGSSAREILARISDRDPLAIGPLCEDRVRRDARLIDPRRLFHRAVARIAHGAARCNGDVGEPVAFFRDMVARAADEVVEEDAYRYLRRQPPVEPLDELTLRLVDALDVEPLLAADIRVVFNRLPNAQRFALFRVIVEGMSLDDYAAVAGVDNETASRLVKDALVAIATLGEYEDETT